MKVIHKKILLIIMPLSLVMGVYMSLLTFDVHNHDGHELTVNPENRSLEDELTSADLIIKGSVKREIDTFQQAVDVNTPLGPMMFNVTTYEIDVNELLHGELKSKTITLYQHGSSKIPEESINHVNEGEDIYLILSKRPDGKGYWSYNFNDGIWKIDGNIVKSKTNSELLEPLNKNSEEAFENLIIDTVEN